jgi:hypothetical protein
MDSFQAFEVLQQWTPNSSTAFLIAQPGLSAVTSAVSSEAGMASALGDHIIVHTMPIAHVIIVFSCLITIMFCSLLVFLLMPANNHNYVLQSVGISFYAS